MAMFDQYRSTDVGAPVLRGQVNSLHAVLYYVLVAGYGTKTAAGWSRPFVSTNGAVFLPPGPGPRFYLQVDDNAPGLGLAREARLRAYHTMTSFTAGLEPFPDLSQAPSGVFARKSATADTVSRPWVIFADSKTFYMFIYTGDSASIYSSFGFGEFYSFNPVPEQERVFIAGRSFENDPSGQSDTFDRIGLVSQTLPGSYLSGDIASSFQSIPNGRVGDIGMDSRALSGALSYKNPADNRIYLSPVRVSHTLGGIQVRGRMRGFWHYCHPASTVSDGDTISGSGDLLGSRFVILKQGPTGGVYCIETTNTVETN